MLVAIALANKMARTIWAMLTKGQDYQNPAEAAAARQRCGWWQSNAGDGGVRTSKIHLGKMNEQIWVRKTR